MTEETTPISRAMIKAVNATHLMAQSHFNISFDNLEYTLGTVARYTDNTTGELWYIVQTIYRSGVNEQAFLGYGNVDTDESSASLDYHWNTLRITNSTASTIA